jgi:hypothetical protein
VRAPLRRTRSVISVSATTADRMCRAHRRGGATRPDDRRPAASADLAAQPPRGDRRHGRPRPPAPDVRRARRVASTSRDSTGASDARLPKSATVTYAAAR